MLIAVPLTYHRQAQTWQYIPHIQKLRDEYAVHPSRNEDLYSGFDPCYEHRLNTEERFLYVVELPTGLIIGPDGTSDNCDPGALSRVLHVLGNHISVKAGWIFTDCILAIGIWIQWYLIGYWLDFLKNADRHVFRWVIPAVVITACGAAMAISEFCDASLSIPVDLITSLLAFFAWCVFIVMFTRVFLKKIFAFRRRFTERP